MCEDVLRHIVDGGSALETLRTACIMHIVSKSLRAAMRPISSELVKQASLELVQPATRGELLDLTHRRLGTLEARLLSLALANGVLAGVHTMWLQDNCIDTMGLRWLASGLRAVPNGYTSLVSLSLGHNRFQDDLRSHNVINDGDSEVQERRRAAHRAVEKLSAAAAARGVLVRINS